MAEYARQTDVPIGRTRDEIERTITRYGATQVAFASSDDQAMVAFVADGRQVRFILPLLPPTHRDFTHTPTGRRRTPAQANTARSQDVKSRWRSLSLVIKAKLEAVAAGIVTFEAEFAMHMVMPDGRVFADHALPAIERAYAAGEAPRLLPGGDPRG